MEPIHIHIQDRYRFEAGLTRRNLNEWFTEAREYAMIGGTLHFFYLIDKSRRTSLLSKLGMTENAVLKMSNDDFLAAVNHAFLPNNAEQVKAELECVCKREFRSISEYTDFFQSYLVGLPQNLIPQSTIEIFINGLNDKKLAERIRNSKPMKLSDAYKTALDDAYMMIYDDDTRLYHKKKSSDMENLILFVLASTFFTATLIISIFLGFYVQDFKHCEHVLHRANLTSV